MTCSKYEIANKFGCRLLFPMKTHLVSISLIPNSFFSIDELEFKSVPTGDYDCKYINMIVFSCISNTYVDKYTKMNLSEILYL